MAEKKHSSSSIMFVVIGIAILLIVLIVPFSGLGKGKKAGGADDDVDQRILPVARVEMKVAPKVTGPRDGVAVYATVCQACHGTGVAGAPKVGDRAAWGPRIAKGLPALLKSALNGRGNMPPKGGAADLTEAELKAGIEHMVGMTK